MLASVLPVLAVLVRPRALPLVAARTCVPLMVRACASTSSPSALDSWLDGALSAERRKRASLVKEAEAARSAERLSAWATLVVANLYRIDDTATSVIVEDWENDGQPTELRFDPDAGTPRQQADAAFVKARRLRRGSAVVAELIKESEARESAWAFGASDLPQPAATWTLTQRWSRPSSPRSCEMQRSSS